MYIVSRLPHQGRYKVQHWLTRQAPVLLVLMLLLPFTNLQAQGQEQTLWQGLKQGNYVALIRHALAPGIGDPTNMHLGDCSTQRNLNQVGRNQAKNIGSRFQAQGITQAQVYTSEWCRCIDTAKLLELGTVQTLPVLNSFFRANARRDSQTTTLRHWLTQANHQPTLVLVTHQVNITSLTGVFPNSGEMIVIKKPNSATETIQVVGRLQTN